VLSYSALAELDADSFTKRYQTSTGADDDDDDDSLRLLSVSVNIFVYLCYLFYLSVKHVLYIYILLKVKLHLFRLVVGCCVFVVHKNHNNIQQLEQVEFQLKSMKLFVNITRHRQFSKTPAMRLNASACRQLAFLNASLQ